MSRLTEEFRQQLSQQPQLNLEVFLAEQRVATDAELLKALLPIEITHRAKNSEPGSEEEFRCRFPQFATVVTEVVQHWRSNSRKHLSATLAHGDSPHESTVQTPVSIGPYEITGLLGRGGMGVVYSAIHRKSKQKVAIKLIVPHLHATPKALQIFLREASILTSLQHPKIVVSKEFGLHEQRPYFIMEYVPNIDLEPILASQSPARRVRVVCKVICKVLDGLQYAHEQGIVHRDVKPSNILVFWTGKKLNCKLADFGLAKRFMDAGMSGLTDQNEVRGTLAFMPPEQLRDSWSAGPAADIYAVGVCMARFLTGSLPYKSTSGHALVSCILRHEIRLLNELLPSCPAELNDIVFRAMQFKAEDRFASASDMHDALLTFLDRSS